MKGIEFGPFLAELEAVRKRREKHLVGRIQNRYGYLFHRAVSLDWWKSEFRLFFRKVKISFEYAKQGWGNYDFESDYMIQDLTWKLERLADSLENDEFQGEDTHKHVKQIRTVLKLLDTTFMDEYYSNYPAKADRPVEEIHYRRVNLAMKIIGQNYRLWWT